MATKILKKRGRKPKNKNPENINVDISPINTEDDTIIAHLPINLEDIANYQAPDEDNDIFIKTETDLTKPKKEIKLQTIDEINIQKKEEEIINNFNKKFFDTDKIFMLGKNINKVNVHNITFKPNSKCFWCRNSFDHPGLEMPEDYFNDTFYCSGNFCSWNCMLAYNTDLNDNNTSKRESLINLMYFKTYGTFKKIIPAGSWLILEEYGGYQSIGEFRKNFDNPSKEYLVLRPPIMTRQLQIEESYKKQNSTMFSENNETEVILKRSKPLENVQNNLEKTLGLKRKPRNVVI